MLPPMFQMENNYEIFDSSMEKVLYKQIVVDASYLTFKPGII
jgi:hypothetical protein